MATSQNQTLVRRFFDEMCNQKKLNVAAELFASDHVYHDPQEAPSVPGPEGMKQVLSTYQAAMPDAHWHVVETMVADNAIVTRWKGTGTQTKELNGIPASGKFLKVEGIWIHTIKNGKIAESWNIWDTLGLLQQLGVVPMMGEAASASMAEKN